MKNLFLFTLLVISLYFFSCKEKECIDVDSNSIQCNIPPTRTVDSTIKLIIGKWSWLEEGPTYNGALMRTPCSDKMIKTATFTNDGKLYIYHNSTLSERYRYSIKRENEFLSPLPNDTFAIIHLTDYDTGNAIRDPQFPAVAFVSVCDTKLYLLYGVIWDTRGNEIWSRQ